MADEPGGIHVGSASVDVVPDATGFQAKLDAKLRDITVKVRLAVDDKLAERELSQAARDRVAIIQAKVEDRLAKAQLDSLARPRTVSVKVKDDGSITKAERQVGLLTGAIVGLGPALVPLAAAGVGGLAGLGAGLLAVATGAGVAYLAFKQLDSSTASGRAFTQTVTLMQSRLKLLQRTAQDGLLPGVNVALRDALPLFPIFNRLVGNAAGAMNGLAVEAGHALQAPFWRNFFDFLAKTAGPNLTLFGRSLGNLLTGFAGLAQAFSPIATEIGVGILHLTERFSAFSTASGPDSGLSRFINYLQTEGPQVAQVLGDLVLTTGKLIQALAPFGAVVLTVVDGFAKFLALPILNLFTSLPGPIQATVVALIALAVLKPRIDAIGASLGNLRTKLTAGGTGTSKLSAGLSGLTGLIGGPYGAALAVGTLALGYFVSKHQQAKQAAQDLYDAIKADTGAVGDNTTALIANKLASDGVLDKLKQYGISASEATQAALGNKDAQKAVNDVLAQYVTAAQSGAAGSQNQAVGLEVLVEKLYDTNRGVQDQIKHYKDVTAATTPWSAATATQAAALGDLALKVNGTTVTIDQLNSALDAILADYQSIPQAQATFAGDLDNLTKKVVEAHGAWTKNHAAINLNTAAGRNLQGIVISAINDNAHLAEAIGKQTGSQDKANAAWNTGRDRLIAQLEKMGLTATQAQKLVDKYGGMADAVKRIPKDASTKFTTPGLDIALQKARALGDTIRANALLVAIGYASGKTYGSTGGAVLNGAIHRGGGGPVYGAGGPTSDIVPAWLSNGEYVLQASAVSALGLRFLNKLNAIGSYSPPNLGLGYRAPSAASYPAAAQRATAGLPPLQIGAVTVKDVDEMARVLVTRQRDAATLYQLASVANGI